MSWWKQKRDAKLYSVLNQTPLFEFYKCLRPDPDALKKAKQDFFEHGIPPQYSYSRAARFDADAYLQALERAREKITELTHEEPVKRLYLEKLDEFATRAQLVQAVQSGDDQRVTELSKNLFGTPRVSLSGLEKELREMQSHAKTFHHHERLIDADTFMKMAERIGKIYDFDFIHVKKFDGSSIKIRHNLRRGFSTAYIPQGRTISKARAARLLTHEFEVHALRRENGLESPYAILAHGLDRYLETEEGLALYFQKQLRKKHAHAPGFWDTYTVLLTQTYAFPEVFEKIFEAKRLIEKKKEVPRSEEKLRASTWNLCMRAYRGITHTSQTGVGYVRDHIYRSGQLLIERLIEEEGEHVIGELFTGRIGAHHLDHIRKLDSSPGRTPQLVSREVVQEVMGS